MVQVLCRDCGFTANLYASLADVGEGPGERSTHPPLWLVWRPGASCPKCNSKLFSPPDKDPTKLSTLPELGSGVRASTDYDWETPRRLIKKRQIILLLIAGCFLVFAIVLNLVLIPRREPCAYELLPKAELVLPEDVEVATQPAEPSTAPKLTAEQQAKTAEIKAMFEQLRKNRLGANSKVPEVKDPLESRKTLKDLRKRLGAGRKH